jgi:hypothetical protein
VHLTACVYLQTASSVWLHSYTYTQSGRVRNGHRHTHAKFRLLCTCKNASICYAHIKIEREREVYAHGRACGPHAHTHTHFMHQAPMHGSTCHTSVYIHKSISTHIRTHKEHKKNQNCPNTNCHDVVRGESQGSGILELIDLP